MLATIYCTSDLTSANILVYLSRNERELATVRPTGWLIYRVHLLSEAPTPLLKSRLPYSRLFREISRFLGQILVSDEALDPIVDRISNAPHLVQRKPFRVLQQPVVPPKLRNIGALIAASHCH